MSRYLAPPDSMTGEGGAGDDGGTCPTCHGVKYVHSHAQHPDKHMRQAFLKQHGNKPGEHLVHCPGCGGVGKAEESPDAEMAGNQEEMDGTGHGAELGQLGEDAEAERYEEVGHLSRHPAGSGPAHIAGRGFPFKRGFTARKPPHMRRHGAPAEKPPRAPGFHAEHPVGRGRLG